MYKRQVAFSPTSPPALAFSVAQSPFLTSLLQLLCSPAVFSAASLPIQAITFPRVIRSFLDEGPVVDQLLRSLFAGADAELGPTTAFGLELIRAFAEEGGEPASAPASDADAGLPEPLNLRESEVIKLVSMGLSNREIGARLGMTEGSVKWYLQGVFAKLNVRRRSMAVLKARKFGLA